MAATRFFFRTIARAAATTANALIALSFLRNNVPDCAAKDGRKDAKERDIVHRCILTIKGPWVMGAIETKKGGEA